MFLLSYDSIPSSSLLIPKVFLFYLIIIIFDQREKKRYRSQSDHSKLPTTRLEPIVAKNQTSEAFSKPKSSPTNNNQAAQKPKFQAIDIDIDPTLNDDNKLIKKITIPIDSRLIKEINNSDHINLDINLRQVF
jgi:hypothetical protein